MLMFVSGGIHGKIGKGKARQIDFCEVFFSAPTS